MGNSLHHVRRLGLLFCCLALCVRSLSAEGAAPISVEESAEKTALGEALFLHNWARPETWTRPERLGKGGDGLGPVFNATSCVECHALGGVGGAGGNEHNVELLSVVIPSQAKALRRTSLV